MKNGTISLYLEYGLIKMRRDISPLRDVTILIVPYKMVLVQVGKVWYAALEPVLIENIFSGVGVVVCGVIQSRP